VKEKGGERRRRRRGVERRGEWGSVVCPKFFERKLTSLPPFFHTLISSEISWIGIPYRPIGEEFLSIWVGQGGGMKRERERPHPPASIFFFF